MRSNKLLLFAVLALLLFLNGYNRSAKYPTHSFKKHVVEKYPTQFLEHSLKLGAPRPFQLATAPQDKGPKAFGAEEVN